MENRKVKSRGIFIYQDKVLLVHNSEHNYYFFPGGSSNNGETEVETFTREIQEEFGSDILNTKLVDTLREVGANRDETISMFRADFINRELYNESVIKIADMDMYAKWIPIDAVKKQAIQLFPEYNYSKMFEKLL